MIPAIRSRERSGYLHMVPWLTGTRQTMRIEIPGAVLRKWTRNDIPSLAHHADNPRIASCLRDGFPSPYTLADAERFIAMATAPSPNLFLAIEVDGEAAGGIGIHPFQDVYRRTAEIGY